MVCVFYKIEKYIFLVMEDTNKITPAAKPKQRSYHSQIFAQFRKNLYVEPASYNKDEIVSLLKEQHDRSIANYSKEQHTVQN